MSSFNHHEGYAGYPTFKGQVLNGQQLWELIEGLGANDLLYYTHLLTGTLDFIYVLKFYFFQSNLFLYLILASSYIFPWYSLVFRMVLLKRSSTMAEIALCESTNQLLNKLWTKGKRLI